MGSEQTCSSTVNKRRFSIQKQGLWIVLSLVDTLNNAIIINISTSIYYSETLSGWIKNTNSLGRDAKAPLKGAFPSTNKHPTLSTSAFIGGTSTPKFIRESHTVHALDLYTMSH